MIVAMKLLIRIAIFQSILNGRVLNEGHFANFCPKLVAMATSLKESEKTGPD